MVKVTDRPGHFHLSGLEHPTGVCLSYQLITGVCSVNDNKGVVMSSRFLDQKEFDVLWRSSLAAHFGLEKYEQYS